jgi:hypothetical protein
MNQDAINISNVVCSKDTQVMVHGNAQPPIAHRPLGRTVSSMAQTVQI